MIVKEVKCKSIINKSRLSDYCINPYIGCQHKCAYCYARFMKKYTNHEEEWGDFLDVKINAVDALKKELKNKRPGSVFIGSVTDAYQPIESKYKMTRKLLEILPKDFSIYIQTKSVLVMRDIDLIQRFKNAEIGFTITFCNDDDRKNFEPFASPIPERIEALKKLKNAGIKTAAFFGPMLPFISDKNLDELFGKAGFVDHVWVDKLNIKSGNWEPIIEIIKKKYPELVEKYYKIFFGKSDYYKKLKNRIKNINKNVKFCY